jgi:hypothetical protein
MQFGIKRGGEDRKLRRDNDPESYPHSTDGLEFGWTDGFEIQLATQWLTYELHYGPRGLKNKAT